MACHHAAGTVKRSSRSRDDLNSSYCLGCPSCSYWIASSNTAHTHSLTRCSSQTSKPVHWYCCRPTETSWSTVRSRIRNASTTSSMSARSSSACIFAWDAGMRQNWFPSWSLLFQSHHRPQFTWKLLHVACAMPSWRPQAAGLSSPDHPWVDHRLCRKFWIFWAGLARSPALTASTKSRREAQLDRGRPFGPTLWCQSDWCASLHYTRYPFVPARMLCSCHSTNSWIRSYLLADFEGQLCCRRRWPALCHSALLSLASSMIWVASCIRDCWRRRRAQWRWPSLFNYPSSTRLLCVN